MDEQWIWAIVAVGVGLALGSICGFAIRRALGSEERRPAVQEVAPAASIFVFWVLTAAGVLVAIAVSSPETLKPIPTDLLAWLPDVAVAGLLLLAGYALGHILSAAVGRSVAGATGSRQRALEGAVRSAVLAGAVILALNQLGVNTSVLNILIAAAAFGAAAALAGIAIVGARSVAPDVAAGRNLQRRLVVGTHIRAGAVQGKIVDLGISHLELETEEGTLQVPYTLIAEQPILILESPT